MHCGRETRHLDLTLPLVEFANNNKVNRTTGESPLEIVHGYSPRTPADLIPLPPDARVSLPTSIFAQHIHYLHAKIRHNITLNNDCYKHSADMCNSLNLTHVYFFKSCLFT